MKAEAFARWPRPIGMLLVAVAVPLMLACPEISDTRASQAAALFTALFVTRGAEKLLTLLANRPRREAQ